MRSIFADTKVKEEGKVLQTPEKKFLFVGSGCSPGALQGTIHTAAYGQPHAGTHRSPVEKTHHWSRFSDRKCSPRMINTGSVCSWWTIPHGREPILEQLLKRCSLWEGLLLEKFVKDHGRTPTLEQRRSVWRKERWKLSIVSNPCSSFSCTAQIREQRIERLRMKQWGWAWEEGSREEVVLVFILALHSIFNWWLSFFLHVWFVLPVAVVGGWFSCLNPQIFSSYSDLILLKR